MPTVLPFPAAPAAAPLRSQSDLEAALHAVHAELRAAKAENARLRGIIRQHDEPRPDPMAALFWPLIWGAEVSGICLGAGLVALAWWRLG